MIMEGPPVSDPEPSERPATFREVLASREFRAVHAASSLSWYGDYVARAAITALVYRQTNSVAISAATFAISYLPWLGIGPILAALVERYPYRRTMVIADLLRMGIVALVAVPGMPVWAMIALVFVTALGNPPFDAARSALLPRLLDGDRYVVALAVQTTTQQAAQIFGYLSGAAFAAYDPRAALLFNAATFGFSACILGLGVRARTPSLAQSERSFLLREAADGFRVVFGTPALRGIAIIVFAAMLFAVVPEGLAAAWAADLSHSTGQRGWVQGAIMVANPVGFVVGGLLVSRLIAPPRRRRLIRLFAVGTPLALVPAMFNPPVYLVIAMSALCGFAIAGLIPAANGLFVQGLPDTHRARAFAVMKSGIQIMQGLAVLVTGALAERFALHSVVGLWSLAGVALMTLVGLRWSGSQLISDAIERARELNGRLVHRMQLPGVPRPTQVAKARIVADAAGAEQARGLDEAAASEAARPAPRRSTANA
jgi:MFS family permease